MTFNKVVFDIETTLTADKVWCIVCKHDDMHHVSILVLPFIKFDPVQTETRAVYLFKFDKCIAGLLQLKCIHQKSFMSSLKT